MRMRVCYLDGHEAGLCCYLLIHTENRITSIISVLLPFVACLLTLPRITKEPLVQMIYGQQWKTKCD
jgi:hypothetical protein